MKKLIVLAATMLAFVAVQANAAPAVDKKAERHYDCSKKGNANKAECKAAATATPASPATSTADAKATKTRAAPKYDCSKKGNANKAACKSEAAATSPAADASAPSGVKPVTATASLAPTIPATPASKASSAAMSGHPVCKKGKPCGNSCIAMTKTCHK